MKKKKLLKQSELLEESVGQFGHEFYRPRSVEPISPAGLIGRDC